MNYSGDAAEQIKKGNRVYLDFMHNPKGLEQGFEKLSSEAYTYLERSGALFGTPIARLRKMNEGAVELYSDHGIDLNTEYLQIAVCAQHCNGGVAVDDHWQSDIEGLYAAGEAAGTFGIYRPGGSALNSTQVGSLRAAEHIAAQKETVRKEPVYQLPQIQYGPSNIEEITDVLQTEMSRVADFDRSTRGMEDLLDNVSKLRDHFFEYVTIEDKTQHQALFRLYDMVLTQRSVLSAMLCSAQSKGTCGSALIDRQPCGDEKNAGMTRTLTRGAYSEQAPISPMPDPELWFETLLARKRKESGI